MKLIISIFFKNLYYFLTDSNFRTFTRLALFKRVKKRHTERTIKFNGLKFIVPDMMSFVWQYHEIFYEQIFLFKPKNEKPIILDCGANVGLASTYFIKNWPNAEIHAFEPDPKVFRFCQNNLSNNFGNNVNLYKQAVWIENTTLEFSSEGADAGSLNTEEDKSSNIIKVDAIDFKSKMCEFERIDFLKMDIEGAENQVIPHIQSELQRVDNLFLEFHSYKDKEQNLGVILNILKESGFRYYMENVLETKIPFMKDISENSMDIQMNIFAYRYC